MTKEECIGLLKRYAEYDGMGIPNLAGCREAMRMAAELLERPSLPSNMDEAAEEYIKFKPRYDIQQELEEGEDPTEIDCFTIDAAIDAFKAGAEWMAGRFQKIEGDLVDWYETKGVDYCYGINTNESFEVPEGFYIKKK